MHHNPRHAQQAHDIDAVASRPSTTLMPAIDRITGRVVTGLLAIIALGVIGSLSVAVYRLIA